MTPWIDAVIAVIVVEAAGLVAWHRATGRGPAPAALLPNLLAGLLLLLAMRLALGGAGIAAVGPCLLVAGAAHLLDLRRRWPSRGGSV